MNSLGISTEPSLLNVELPDTLTESPSVSTFRTFLAEEEASICPLLSSVNGSATPLTFSHPLTPSVDNDSNASTNLCNEDGKGETSSSTGSSSGIAMEVADTLFTKHNYQHLQINNNGIAQDLNGRGPNGNITLSDDTPSFVSWNWPLIRKCTFFVFISSLLAMCSIVVAMIVTLPSTCNPRTTWYRGSVFYEIFPSSFQDSNNDGLGDLHGIASRVEYLAALGVAAVRLNSIFSTPHYPEDYENVTTIYEISPAMGGSNGLLLLAETLHDRNISLVLDLPVEAFLKELTDPNKEGTVSVVESSTANSNFSISIRNIAADTTITKALRKWIELGVDGFYIKGLEDAVSDIDLVCHLAEWKRIIGPNRILIISEATLNKLDAPNVEAALAYIDLVDVHLNVLNGTQYMADRIRSLLNGYLKPTESSAWIHWSVGGVDKDRITRHGKQDNNATLAAILMQLTLPGTPSLFYGDEIALGSVYDPHNEHNETKHLHHLPTMRWVNSTLSFTNRETLPWLPQTANHNFDNIKAISDMIELRERSPSIYKNSICKTDTNLPNTQIRHSHDDILVVERIYPRRNSFVAVSNFGSRRVNIDMTSMFYSGISMIGRTQNERIYFKDLQIEPLDTIVIKLDK